jgi:type IV secretory pathway protease TraF
VQPVLKPVVAVAGDVVEVGLEAVTVNGRPLPGSSSAAVDSLGRTLPIPLGGGTSSQRAEQERERSF